jgi:hypothetical protein
MYRDAMIAARPPGLSIVLLLLLRLLLLLLLGMGWSGARAPRRVWSRHPHYCGGGGHGYLGRGPGPRVWVSHWAHAWNTMDGDRLYHSVHCHCGAHV